MPAKHFFIYIPWYRTHSSSIHLFLYLFIFIFILFGIFVVLFGDDILTFCYFVFNFRVCVFVGVAVLNLLFCWCILFNRLYLRLTYKYMYYIIFLSMQFSVFGSWLSDSLNSLIYGLVSAIHY